MNKKYEAVEREDLPENREVAVTKEFVRQQQKKIKIDDLLTQLRTEFPNLRDQFEQIRMVKIPT
jgi:uncharacterized protein YqeY